MMFNCQVILVLSDFQESQNLAWYVTFGKIIKKKFSNDGKEFYLLFYEHQCPFLFSLSFQGKQEKNKNRKGSSNINKMLCHTLLYHRFVFFI